MNDPGLALIKGGRELAAIMLLNAERHVLTLSGLCVLSTNHVSGTVCHGCGCEQKH